MGELAAELFDRLRAICPPCSYAPWGNFLDSMSTSVACSALPDEVVLRARVRVCAEDVQACNLSTHLEFFHSLANPYLLVTSSVYLLDKNCPLYTTSAQSTDCLSSSSPIAAAVGAAFGGLIVGAVTAVVICLIVAVVIVKRRARETEEDNPHPMTFKNSKKASMKSPKGNKYSTGGAGKEIEVDEGNYDNYDNDPGYEFLPTFKNQTMEEKARGLNVEYDNPQNVISGLPSAANRQSAEYEIPDIDSAGNAFEMQVKATAPYGNRGGKMEGKAKLQGAKKKGAGGRAKMPKNAASDAKSKTLQQLWQQQPPPGQPSSDPTASSAAKQSSNTLSPATAKASQAQPAAKIPATQQQQQQPAAKAPIQPAAKSTAQQKIPQPPPPPPPPDEPQEGEQQHGGFKAMRKKLVDMSGATVVKERNQVMQDATKKT